MKRTRRESLLKPVQKVEVSNKHVALRVVLFVVALLIAIGAFAYFLTTLLNSSKGWTEITANGDGLSCAGELSFYYYLGSDGRNATTEKKALTQAYTEICANAYRIFDTSNENNIGAINANPNKIVKVGSPLYQALKAMVECDAKLLLLGPIYERRANIFYANSDFEAQQFDPAFSEQEKTFYEDILTFVNNADDISLEILGDSSVRLNVSERYLEYAKDCGVSNFVDFFYLKNAFIVDYVVDSLVSQDYNIGFISSIDGFTRTLSGKMADNVITLFDSVNGLPYACASIDFKQAISAVNLHNFKIRAYEQYYYYYANGSVVSPFLGVDGSTATSTDFLFCYSKDVKCSQVLLTFLSQYISDNLDVDALKNSAGNGYYCVYVNDKTVCYTQAGLNISVNQNDEDNPYTKQLVE